MSPRFWPHRALVLALGCAAFSPLVPLRAAPVQDTYRTYHNARYGTTTVYPSNLVSPRPEADNGDGRKFLSRDGRIQITAYGAHNVFGHSARGELASEIAGWKSKGARLSYSRFTASWFALSGTIGTDIFYQKTLLRGDTLHTLIWQYPQTLKKRLDADVSRSVTAFRIGDSIENPKPMPGAAKPVKTGNARPKIAPTPRPTAAPIGGY